MLEQTYQEQINERLYKLNLFLNTYIDTPNEGPLSNHDKGQITRMIQFTSNHGTKDQNATLYLFLLSTRSILWGREQELLRAPLVELTTLFKQHQPDIANDVETTISQLP